MECLCLFIHPHTIWSKNLFRIWWSFVIKTLETPKNIKAKGSSTDYIKNRVINGDNKK